MTGSVRGFQYRRSLNVEMTQDELKVSISAINIRVLTLPIANILYVKQLRNILTFGINVIYKVEYGNEVLKLSTWDYEVWCDNFALLGVKVVPYKGWFDFG